MMKWRKEGLQEEEKKKKKTTVAAVQTEDSEGYISLTLFLSFFKDGGSLNGNEAARLQNQRESCPLRVLSC